MKFKAERIEGSLLAGVCAGIAQAFQWNVWVLRALFVAFLLTKTLWAIGTYAVLAVVFIIFDDQLPNGSERSTKTSRRLNCRPGTGGSQTWRNASGISKTAVSRPAPLHGSVSGWCSENGAA